MNALDVEAIQNLLLGATLALPRVMVCLMLVPLFTTGGQMPRTLRIAIALGLSFPAAFGVAHGLAGSATMVPVPAIVLKEAIIGLLLGVVLAAPFWAIESAGALLDQQRGENAGQAVTPFSEGQASIMGSAMKQALVIYLVATGGIGLFYELLLTSFEAWPVLSLVPPFSIDDRDQILARFSEMARLGVLYASPFVMALIVIDFSFALLGVTAPNLQTYFAAMPAKSLAGIFVLFVYFNTFMQHGGDYFVRSIAFVRALFAN